MPKQIVCHECKGHGNITLTRMFNDYCGIGSKQCEACGGKGYFEVPMTNADRIRAMSDEELNDLFREIYNSGIEDAVAYEWGKRANSFKWTMVWLQQPAEGE